MSTQHDSEGFMSTPLEGEGARRKDNYYQDSEENKFRFREADDEYQRLKEDFARAETRYSAFDRELLAVYATIKHFRHNLEGCNFFVNIDHKPLTFVMSSVTERASLRQTRHLAFIAEFTTDIRYVKGETNFVADALSRPSVSVIHDGPEINYRELSIDQAKDAEFTRLRHSPTSTMNFKLLKSFDNQLIWCDVSTGHNRPYLTAKFCRKVFSNLHGLGHPSHRATKPLINTICLAWHEY